jgi:hypothetical protein
LIAFGIYTTKTRADPRLFRLFEGPVFRNFFGDMYAIDQAPRECRKMPWIGKELNG